MLARVLASIPERVLTYAIDEAIQPRLSAALKKLHIEEYQVSPEELGESVGHLAGLPGFNEKKATPPAEGTAVSCRGVLCMCGFSNKRMDELLDLLRREDIRIPLRAKMTETNKNWSFGAWIEELSREHEAVIQRLKKQQEATKR